MCKNCGMENALETDVNCWHCKQPMANDSRSSACSAVFDAEKKAIEFQELFFPEAGKLVRTAVRFSFAQGFRMAQKQNIGE
jgi:hypothetical protein